MSSHLVIIGAGGHAKVCYEIAMRMKKWSTIIILDDDLENDFFEVRGCTEEYVNYPNADFFVAIGSNKVRRFFNERIRDKQLNLTTLIDPNSIISNSAQLGVGTVVMPGVIINPSTIIGNGVILNTAVSIDHDNVISDYVHISPGSHIAGNVTVGQNSWIGIGTIVKNNVSITNDIIVGAASNVIEDLEKPGTYFGNPAKFIKER